MPRVPFAVLLPLLALLLGACDTEEAALRVGPVHFAPQDVASLAPAQVEELADLAALGVASADGRTDSLVAPLVRHERERARLQALPYHLGAQRLGIGEDRLRAAYTAAPEWELRVRHVVRLVSRWAAQAKQARQREIAEQVARRARAGEDFAALAAEFSEEPGAAERGGLLQPGREGSWVDPFWDAARRLEPGGVSPVVETEYGYHVLRLDDRRPVPFDEAARLPLLRRVVPTAQAIGAMEEWVARQPPVVLDPPGVLAARAALRRGALPDSLVLARAPSGGAFTARDLAIAWAMLDHDQRESLRRVNDTSFGIWVEGEARESLWSAAARELGVEPPAGTEAKARARWEGSAARWAAAFGFRPGLTPAQVAAAALAGVGSRGQEARIARAELAAMRPLLRRLYPAAGPSLASAASSSSEMRNSESTR